jgi:CheY-like chemotaxis protein
MGGQMDTEAKRATVLAVDDEPINIEFIVKGLGREYEILAATSGREALELVERCLPDLVILDVKMPDMDGYETYRRLKEIEAFKDTPVIFVSGLDAEEYELLGLELGAADYLIKPIRPALVGQRVRNILELKASRGKLAAQVLELRELNRRLQAEIENVKTLRGLLPICCVCKKIRDDKGYWNQIEAYISENAGVEFSHGYCPECIEKTVKQTALDKERLGKAKGV